MYSQPVSKRPTAGPAPDHGVHQTEPRHEQGDLAQRGIPVDPLEDYL
jgi:hypothetical protein